MISVETNEIYDIVIGINTLAVIWSRISITLLKFLIVGIAETIFDN